MLKKYILFLLILLPTLGFAQPIPAADAFKLSTKLVDPNTFYIRFDIKPGFFLYSKRIKLTHANDDGLQIGTIRYPNPITRTDKVGHVSLIYNRQLTLNVPVLSDKPQEVLVNIAYQGCSYEGFCYPPENRTIQLSFNNDSALNQVLLEPKLDTTPKPLKTTNVNLDDNSKSQYNLPPQQNTGVKPKARTFTKIDKLFSTKHWSFVIFSFYGFGLLLAFTPCVLPMVPVLSGIIVGHGHNISTKKALFLSLSYVLSMSLTYGIIGGFIALMGSNLQVVMQSSIAISIFSLVFIVLALSMFNLYELRLPVSWQAKLAAVTRSHEGGHYLTAALMGSMSILVLSPCVTAPLIGALSYIAQTGNVTLGLSSLFFLGLGMGTPLLLIGTSAGKLLPKAGSWMNIVKALFGVMMLGVAIYLMSRILPEALTMGLWAALCIGVGVFIRPASKLSDNVARLKQATSIILVVYGILILVGASLGNVDPFLPLKNNDPNLTLSNQEKSIVVSTLPETKHALALAKEKKQPVMLDFYASWCESCKIIAATTLQNKQVLSALDNVTKITVDLTKNNDETKKLLNYFNVVAPPTFLFYNNNGVPQEHLRLVGEISTNTILDRIRSVMDDTSTRQPDNISP